MGCCIVKVRRWVLNQLHRIPSVHRAWRLAGVQRATKKAKKSEEWWEKIVATRVNEQRRQLARRHEKWKDTRHDTQQHLLTVSEDLIRRLTAHPSIKRMYKRAGISPAPDRAYAHLKKREDLSYVLEAYADLAEKMALEIKRTRRHDPLTKEVEVYLSQLRRVAERSLHREKRVILALDHARRKQENIIAQTAILTALRELAIPIKQREAVSDILKDYISIASVNRPLSFDELEIVERRVRKKVPLPQRFSPEDIALATLFVKLLPLVGSMRAKQLIRRTMEAATKLRSVTDLDVQKV